MDGGILSSFWISLIAALAAVIAAANVKRRLVVKIDTRVNLSDVRIVERAGRSKPWRAPVLTDLTNQLSVPVTARIMLLRRQFPFQFVSLVSLLFHHEDNAHALLDFDLGAATRNERLLHLLRAEAALTLPPLGSRFRAEISTSEAPGLRIELERRLSLFDLMVLKFRLWMRARAFKF